MTPNYPRLFNLPGTLWLVLGALFVLPALAGCKLVEAGNDGLSAGVLVGYSAVPNELVGSFWGGKDDQCAYAFGFPAKDRLEGLVKCTSTASQKSITTQVVRRVGFKREADTDGLATWSLYVPAGFLSASCPTLPSGALEAQSFMARLSGTGAGRKLENAYRKGHWLPSAELQVVEVEALRQEAVAGPGCQAQD